MAEFLAYRILDSKLEFDKVPASLKEEVKNNLVDMGHEELTKLNN